MGFESQLKHVRAAKNLTQEQARAVLFDVPHRTFAAWETGERTPPAWLQNLILSRLERAKKGDGPRKPGRKPRG